MRTIQLCIIAAVLATATTCLASSNQYGKETKPAIVIASFGTTELEALESILNIQNTVKEAFPHTKVALTFTSNIIRNIWQKRAADPAWTAAHPKVPTEVLHVKGVLATMGLLQDQGYNALIVQPTHIAHAEQFIDLKAYVDGLDSIKTIKAKYRPFHALAVGRPLTGSHGLAHDYNKDIEILAETMDADAKLARKNNSALIYMAHGNDHFSTGVFNQFQEVMRRMYPKVTTYVGGVEGYPGLTDVMAELKRDKVKKATLMPLMIVAGDHAKNDMAGDDEDSWKNTLSENGIAVTSVLKGIGSNDKVAAIFVEHIRDAATSKGLTLR